MRALGESLGNQRSPGAKELAAGMRAFAARITDLGKAGPGDKTMMDALLPFTEAFARLLQEGAEPRQAWASAALDAVAAAEATASLRPLKGRARPLAEKSVGTPDPGATSLAMIFTVMGPFLADSGRPGSREADTTSNQTAGALS
ncbi:putative kinase MCAP_0235 [Arthrobacter sp. Hiyo4]|nr:putative kinase MCAP_0235 [Arthrobacter sp. Hiyo4]